MKLPRPLCKFANRAKILTGHDLKSAILDAKVREQQYLERENATVTLLETVVETYKKIPTVEGGEEIAARTLKVLQECLEQAKNTRIDTQANILECIAAINEYDEILVRDGKVEPS